MLCVFSQVSLQYNSYNDGYYYHICGGTIIDAFYIMTAAHCILRSGSHWLSILRQCAATICTVLFYFFFIYSTSPSRCLTQPIAQFGSIILISVWSQMVIPGLSSFILTKDYDHCWGPIGRKFYMMESEIILKLMIRFNWMGFYLNLFKCRMYWWQIVAILQE